VGKMGQTHKDASERRGPSASFKVGAIALAFLVIGYQVALFVHRAAVARVVSLRDAPDTVFVMDEALARRLLSENGTPSAGGTASGSGGVTWGNGTSFAGGTASGVGGTASGSGSGGTAVGGDASGAQRRVEIRRPYRHEAASDAIYESRAERVVENFPFDPNTVSLEDLRRLGFSEKQAQSIDNYRRSGGRFRRKSDFAKSYVVADSVYKRLEPFIDIPLVDINKADSAAFDALPGIGGFYASKMIEYREQLRGYSYPEQLMDIYRFDEEKFDGLKDLITVGTDSYPPYPLWTLPEKELEEHPYIGKYAAHGVVLFREHNPASELSVEALVKAGVLKKEAGEKLSRCRIE